MKFHLANLPGRPNLWAGGLSALLAFLPLAHSAAQSAARQQLQGHVPSVTTRLPVVGGLDASKQLNLAIGLPLRNQAELKALLQDLYNPASPNFRHYLKPVEFTERFGPSQGDYQAVLAFAKLHNLTLTATHPNRMLVDVVGTVADIEKALNINLKVYQHPSESRQFYAPDVEPSLDLSTPVLSISGLSDYVLPHPMNLKRKPIAPNGGGTPFLGSGPGGTYMGYDFRAAYLPGVSLDGSGQSVGLLQFDGYFPNDIAIYASQAGLAKVPLINVFLDGYNGIPGGANGEVALDIEMSMAMAPGLSSIIVYSAGPFGNGNDILNRMATDNLAAQLSSSWSYRTDATTDQIFQEIIAQGQTFFNASGDFDAWYVEPFPPCNNPYLTIVGGTTLSTTGPVGDWVSETVWNYYGTDVGSGGGISGIYSIPTWQQGVDMSTNGGSTVFRNIPDVALTGDNVYSVSDNGFGGFTAGTSCASPLWAGVAALINQQAVDSGAPPIGFLNPAIYAIGKGQAYTTAFHDITTGNNTNSVSTNLFFASLGYDLCTGWGTPSSTNLFNLLVTPSPIPLPRLLVVTNIVYGGNNNGVIDYNECNTMDLVLTNVGRADATDIHVTVSTATRGVIIAQPISAFPNIATNASGTNIVSFKISTAPEFVCGVPIELDIQIKCDQNTVTRHVVLPTGVPGLPLRFDNSTPAFIPDVGSTNSIIVVSNVNFALSRIAVSLYISHTFDSDLVLQLISPDGVTNTLARNSGGAGHNFGLACSPDGARTTFDDLATNSIISGFAPFVGAYQPAEPLAIFAGKAGTNVNGAWRLLVSDTQPFDTGTLQCWSLIVTPTTCTNGGGECPGSDLAVGMKTVPEPALVGQNLTYNLSVTNLGPSGAHTVSVSQVLPSSVVFVSASSSQGAVGANNGVVTANLGPMSAGSTAAISVVVLPAIAGVFSSTATVSSDQPDFNPQNNSATAIAHVNPPSADLTVGLSAAPNSVVVGATVIYTLAVTNNGPSPASGIVASSVYPDGMVLRGESISQGSLYVTNGNTVVCLFGSLSAGARAIATITTTAAATGTLVASAIVSSTNPNEIDPVQGNNSATAAISVGPAADLALGLGAFPNPDVVTSNLTLITTITNFGPSPASATVVSEALPTALTNISITIVPSGTYTLAGTNLTVNLGTLSPGATATITVVGGTIKQGYLSCAANVAATETDPNLGNNSSSVTVTVALPFVDIEAAGASLTSPATGFLDNGQTNVVQFRLQNLGNVANTNLVVTLLTNSTVTPLSGPQTYGILRPIGVPGGVPVSRAFTFISSGANGGTVTATLSLKDASNTNLPPVTFTFLLPTITPFANPNVITIPDPNNMPTFDSGPATPYPSTIAVSGVTGQVARVTATLVNLTHTFPHDINALLVGPTGAKTLLLSHAADASSVTAATVTFDDAASAPLPEVGSISSGTWQPSAYSPSPVFSNPAPVGPYTASLGTFGGLNPNGTWSLYVYDDGTGDAGHIDNGWSLSFITVTPVNQIADVGVSGVAAASPALAGDLLTYTFTVDNAGPSTATGVTFSNALPSSLVLLSAASSQGNVITNNNAVIGNLASLAAGSNATVTVVAKVTLAAVGQLTNTAYVSAFEADLHSPDNRVSVVTPVGVPVADLALGISPGVTNATVGTNLVYSVQVTNNGPGNALNAVVTDPLPSGVAYVSASSSVGTVTVVGGSVVANLGDLAVNAVANLSITVRPQQPTLLTNVVSAATASTDPAPGNNVASAVVTVRNPSALIVPAGSGLVFEGFSPPDGVIDPGEQVTVSLNLANIGVLDSANLVATLLATNGVTAPGPAATYGRLVAGGAPVSRNFNFTASASATGSVVATLHLTDGALDLGLVAFTFNLPAAYSFANTNAIIIPDHGPASPYPSIINVTGLTGYVSKVTATLYGLTHSFPSDVNVLLVSPAGSRTLLMSHNGGAYAVTNITLTFDDAGPAILPSSARLVSGTNRPSRFGSPVTFPSPAPASPYSATLSALDNISPNGVWSLYVLDDSAGDSGAIASGWSLNLSTVNPSAPLADLAVGMTVTPASVVVGGTLIYTINVTNLGPSTASTVLLIDTLPQGIGLVSNYVSSGAASYAGGTLTWTLGDLPVGASALGSITVSPSVAGTFLNEASVSGNCTDLDPNNNSAQVFATATPPVGAVLSGIITNGYFQLTVTAPTGFVYQVLASTNLSSWTSIGSFSNSTGVFSLRDTNSPSFPTRYYRTVR